jgi:D-serine deaminase-like pyridoxal phosphate-dependent protein
MLGACGPQQLALAVACPVVGRFPERREIALYGGAVHFSKDSVPAEDGRTIYGYLMHSQGGQLGEPALNVPVVALSQEHGQVRLPDSAADEIAVGDAVLVLPAHACLTCALHASYRSLAGEHLGRMPQ